MASNAERVTFVHRKATKRDGYSCTTYELTPAQFFAHVEDFVHRAQAFESALGFSEKEIGNFASYAIPEKSADEVQISDHSD